jgi:hypothetical protein
MSTCCDDGVDDSHDMHVLMIMVMKSSVMINPSNGTKECIASCSGMIPFVILCTIWWFIDCYYTRHAHFADDGGDDGNDDGNDADYDDDD